MKMIKCDRCGKVDDGPIYSMGCYPFYIGQVREYSYGEMPGINNLDLCNKCQSEFDGITTKFMEKKGDKTRK